MAFPGRCSATPLYAPTHRSQLILQVAQIRARFKVVPPRVRHDSRFQHVNLPYAPPVESLFRKEVVEDPLVSDLNIPHPRPQASHTTVLGNSPFVRTVHDPSNGTPFSLPQGRDPDLLKRDTIPDITLRNASRFPMRSLDSAFVSIQSHIQRQRYVLAIKKSSNPRPMRKVLAKRHGTHFTDVLSHRRPVEQRARRISGQPVNPNLEEPPRILPAAHGFHCYAVLHNAFQRVTSPHPLAKAAAVPHHTNDRCRHPGTRRERNGVPERQAHQPPNPSKPPATGPLLAARDRYQRSRRRRQRQPRPIVKNAHASLTDVDPDLDSTSLRHFSAFYRIGSVLDVLPIQCQRVRIHAGRNESQNIHTHDCGHISVYHHTP